ncbi:isochorismate synthase [Virgibacillus sp. W0430]|uniref:isochorismate synthase n=1 Tax=Virgibacillus sp. W0430 TaxID=3391580 RepID=UPI003F4589EE
MIEVKEKSMESVFSLAIQKANKQNTVQIASFTQEIRIKDLLKLFEAAKKFNKNRMFWTSTEADYSIVGIGKTWEITAQSSRFTVTKQKWEQLLAEAIVHDPYEAEGTGIVALGGMSFDPDGQQTTLWKNFLSSQFIVPEFIVFKNKSKSYLTMTSAVQPNDQLDTFISKWNQIVELLDAPVQFPQATTIRYKKEIGSEEWIEIVKKAIDEIKKQRVKKIVLARELRVKLNKQAEVAVVLKNLINKQKNSFIFAFEQGEDCFLGATPERLVKIHGTSLFSTCLAGTAPRGRTKMEDNQISEALLHDEKNREEHDYVVQMIKKSVEDYCTDIDIPTEPIVYQLKNLHHLYTPVHAKIKKEVSLFDIIEKLHPTPALGGVPREESLAFIRENEQLDRGWYGAPVGWIDSKGNGEFAVAIRSGLIQGDEVSLFAGCGVMKDSNPEAEYEETKVKLLPMLTVLEGS